MLKGYKKTGMISKDTLLRMEEDIKNSALERFLEASSKEESSSKSDGVSEQQMMARKRVIGDNDSIAMERILGTNDLIPVSYLQSGFRVAKSVCRVMIRNRVGTTIGSGTGFMIAPGIMMTNNHVIPDIASAEFSLAAFNYQNDEDCMPCPISYFNLNPDRFFLTDIDLDFTIVALQEEDVDGKKLEDFGYLELVEQAGKVLEGEYVSIIQHPKGGPKCVTLRENQVKFVFDNYIHYMTDTEPGSSGSPVFNDQWVVVALHHSGVPNPAAGGGWIANEGVRISSIAQFIKNEYDNMERDAKKIVRDIFPSMDVGDEPDGPDEPDDQVKSQGYDADFLGDSYRVELPKLSETMEEDATRMKNGSYVLDYTHFSIVMCKSRGLAYFTGVNIDGNQRVKVKRSNDKWRFDKRISEEYQYGNEVYKRNDLDRGHLVRRNDPNWGEEAFQANEDTFHYTNSAPQHKNLNQKIWLGLEDYILNNANNRGLKVSVFTGPVFKESDMVYREKYRVPEEFWKVAVMVKDDGELSATAYLQTQEDMLGDLEFAYGAYETYQVPVKKIEEITGLCFGDLSKHDPIANIEFSGLRITEEKHIRL